METSNDEVKIFCMQNVTAAIVFHNLDIYLGRTF
jgi:hypothetical protein